MLRKSYLHLPNKDWGSTDLAASASRATSYYCGFVFHQSPRHHFRVTRAAPVSQGQRPASRGAGN
jgi:hypothetical protein